MERLLKCCWICRKGHKKVQPAALNPNEIVLEAKTGEWGKRSSSATVLGRLGEGEQNSTVVGQTHEKVARSATPNKPLIEYVFPRLPVPISPSVSLTC